jgi:DNA-binding transcriptional ArsR family regulator
MNEKISSLDLTPGNNPALPCRSPHHRNATQIGEVFSALASYNRRRILSGIRMHAKSVKEIASDMRISRPAVSQHLQVLLKAGLVTYETEGSHTFYRLDLEGLKNLQQYLAWLQTHMSVKAKNKNSGNS